MTSDKELRQQIAFEAARLLFYRHETDYPRAKRRAARRTGARFRVDDLPTNREVRDQLRRITQVVRAEGLDLDPRAIQLEAVRLMRRLRPFHPLLLTEQPSGSKAASPEIVVRVHADDFEAVTDVLRRDGLRAMPQPLRRGFGEHDSFVPIAVDHAYPCRLIVVDSAQRDQDWRNPATGEIQACETLDELENRLRGGETVEQFEAELEGIAIRDDRFAYYRQLLVPLEEVRQDPVLHPEGDALYHSLQLFDLAARERPYDEEFLTAALLHDVGKAIDADDPATSGAAALDGAATRRTRWLIAQLPTATRYRARQLSVDERRALEASDDFDDVLLLSELNEVARQPGVDTTSLDEALAYLRSLESGALWEDGAPKPGP